MPRTEPDALRLLVKKAMEAFNALTPEEQAAHRREQAISFAFGQAALSWADRGKELTKEEEEEMRQRIADAYDRKITRKT